MELRLQIEQRVEVQGLLLSQRFEFLDEPSGSGPALAQNFLLHAPAQHAYSSLVLSQLRGFPRTKVGKDQLSQCRRIHPVRFDPVHQSLAQGFPHLLNVHMVQQLVAVEPVAELAEPDLRVNTARQSMRINAPLEPAFDRIPVDPQALRHIENQFLEIPKALHGAEFESLDHFRVGLQKLLNTQSDPVLLADRPLLERLESPGRQSSPFIEPGRSEPLSRPFQNRHHLFENQGTPIDALLQQPVLMRQGKIRYRAPQHAT